MSLEFKTRACGGFVAGLLCSTLFVSAAAAQERTYPLDLPREPLAEALRDLGRATDQQLIFTPELVKGRYSHPVKGRLEAAAALDQILAGTGLQWRRAPLGGIMIEAAAGGVGRGSQAPAVAAEPPSVETVVVTGTHIGGAAPVGARPVVLDRASIARLGRSNAADLLKTLPEDVPLGLGEETRGSFQASPQNLGFAVSPNLRGLGVDATLSLLDGVRLPPTSWGGVVDVAQIPLVALDRVEVLPDGASAVYGSDAVGGVVNFILKKGIEGGEARVRAGAADGLDEQTYDLAWGRRWSSGNLFGALEYERRTSLAAASRSYFTDDLRAFGGPDLRLPYASPGTIVVGSTTYPIPTGQDGTALTAAQLVAGPARTSDRWEAADILPSIHRLSAAFDLQQDLTAHASVFFEAVGQSRESVRRDTPFMTTLVVPRSNPFFVSPVAGASSVNVRYSFLGDLGPMAPRGRVEDALLTGGLRGDLPGGWEGVAQATFAHDRVNYFYNSLPNLALLGQALADPDPAAAFNPFGDRGSNSAAVIDRIRGYVSNRSHLSYGEFAANASGPLFSAPGGVARLAVGVEARHEHLVASNASFISRAVPTLSGFNLGRDVDAAYAEINLPLVGPDNARPGLRAFSVSAAVRTERYSDAGSTTNPRLGAEWSPIADLRFSATWGTSFKAPSLFQSSTALNGAGVVQLPLQGAPGGVVNLIELFGNAPGLTPEKARTWTLGADWRPSAWPGLKLGAHLFSVRYRDRILTPTVAELSAALASSAPSPLAPIRSPTAAQVAAYYADPTFTGSFRPPADQIFAVVDFRAANLGAVEQSGADLDAAYSVGTRLGRIGALLDAVYIDRYAVARLPGQALVSRRNTSSSPIAWRGDAALTWSQGPWNGMLRLNYVGAYQNTTVTPAQDVAAWTTLDLHLAYAPDRVLGRDGVTLALDVQNLFDRDPPRVANFPAAVGYDTEVATALGRMASVTVAKSW